MACSFRSASCCAMPKSVRCCRSRVSANSSSSTRLCVTWSISSVCCRICSSSRRFASLMLFRVWRSWSFSSDARIISAYKASDLRWVSWRLCRKIAKVFPRPGDGGPLRDTSPRSFSRSSRSIMRMESRIRAGVAVESSATASNARLCCSAARRRPWSSSCSASFSLAWSARRACMESTTSSEPPSRGTRGDPARRKPSPPKVACIIVPARAPSLYMVGSAGGPIRGTPRQTP
mmetsp:Transcript_31099/g.75707  ORF Transcript_31099/g.75707 Transcript_31099/m.75707 type:complete len:233 (+) Transcript_31099:1785-2483(+)